MSVTVLTGPRACVCVCVAVAVFVAERAKSEEAICGFNSLLSCVCVCVLMDSGLQ